MLRLTTITSAGGKVIHKNFSQAQVNKMITLYSECFNNSTLLDDSHYLICLVEPEPEPHRARVIEFVNRKEIVRLTEADDRKEER